MRNEAFEEAVTRVLKTDARFPREAYRLISVALEHAVRALHADRRDGTASDETDASGRQHVTARQLAIGFRDFVLNEYGPFAKGILDDCNLHSTDDIGIVVYNLIAVGAFGKTERDSIDDFHALYDFHETFVEPFLAQYE